jgi:hypothetical protein
LVGRDPEARSVLARPGLDGYSPDEIARLTTSPARYRFHATLKPPFRLNDGASPQDMYDALRDLLVGFSAAGLGFFADDAFVLVDAPAPARLPLLLTFFAPDRFVGSAIPIPSAPKGAARAVTPASRRLPASRSSFDHL